MNEFRESGYPEKKQETEHSLMRETDAPLLFPNAELIDNPFLDSSDIFEAAFRNFGFTAATSDKKISNANEADGANEVNEDKDYSDFLEKRDGKHYDKETGKAYDSSKDWEMAQNTLAKRYSSIAEFYENKARREWGYFKNSDANGESDSKKWNHYRSSQECYAKSKEFKENAERVLEKLEKLIMTVV